MATTLSEEIASWDGKSAAVLQAAYERHSGEEGFVATILAHISDVQSQRAATWLLKKHLEDRELAICCRLPCGLRQDSPFREHWEAKLHVLQCLPYLDIPEDDTIGLEQFLDACLESERKFVRAWAYNGFNELALRFPRYREKVDGMLARAGESESASVRARIRNIRKGR